MQIYLPIAEVSVNAFLLLGLGGLVGILSGMFGVGGGFLITPLLFFAGIPPAVAVATSANQIVASSISGVLAHLKRRTVDIKMGTVLLAGGLLGAALGVQIFNILKEIGQVDLFVRLCYVLFLGVIGAHETSHSEIPGDETTLRILDVDEVGEVVDERSEKRSFLREFILDALVLGDVDPVGEEALEIAFALYRRE